MAAGCVSATNSSASASVSTSTMTTTSNTLDTNNIQYAISVTPIPSVPIYNSDASINATAWINNLNNTPISALAPTLTTLNQVWSIWQCAQDNGRIYGSIWENTNLTLADLNNLTSHYQAFIAAGGSCVYGGSASCAASSPTCTVG